MKSFFALFLLTSLFANLAMLFISYEDLGHISEESITLVQSAPTPATVHGEDPFAKWAKMRDQLFRTNHFAKEDRKFYEKQNQLRLEAVNAIIDKNLTSTGVANQKIKEINSKYHSQLKKGWGPKLYFQYQKALGDFNQSSAIIMQF